MKIIKECFRNLKNFVAELPLAVRKHCMQYGLSVFTKTRMSSHMYFLRRCLNLKVIPHGFRIKPSVNLSSIRIQNHCDRASATYSKRLMRCTLHDMSSKLKSASQRIHESVSFLESSSEMSNSHMKKLKKCVYRLNQSLYASLKNIKAKKLNVLAPHLQQEISDDDNVVTIPDDLPLSSSERRVLSKGLKFIPTPKRVNEDDILLDLEKFYRRIRLHAHFNDPNQNIRSCPEDDDDIFRKYQKKNSDWTPLTSPLAVDSFVNRCREEIKHLPLDKIPKRSNLSKEERTAISSIKNRDDLVIKPADKGGAVVAWRKDLYVIEANRQLSDSTFYRKDSSDLTESNNKIILKTLNDEINKGSLPDGALNLIIKNPRCGKFYLLPKIHKVNNPGRPVVSACSCPTEIISAFLDDQFQPFVEGLSSYVKDTNHLIKIINELPTTTAPRLLYTMDVKSIYTVIPNSDGLKALRYFLNKRPVCDPPTDSLIRLAELVLTLNHFEFDGDYYTQISGVSMGTRMGPSYACLFMGYLEQMFFSTYQGKTPEVYKRYIDDCWGTTILSRSELESFINGFNQFHPSIEFTYEISDTGLSCLDVDMRVLDNTITTSVHYKPTDKHAYLRYDSHHPLKCRNSIPYSQFLRLKRICSDDDNFTKECANMSQFFLKRGYPQNIVNEALDRVSKVKRTEALQAKTNENSNKIPLVITYSSVCKKIVGIVKRNARILSNDSDIGPCFDNNIVTAYKNANNLKSSLVRASLPSDEIPGTFPCGRTRCKTCDHVNGIPLMVGPLRTFDIRKSFSCTSTGVIYAITCLKCSSSYIGETSQKLGTRFRQHVGDVNNRRFDKSDVASHFNTCCNGDINQMSIRGLLTIPDSTSRKVEESQLIKRLGTLLPFGMNREDSSWQKHH